MTPEEDGNTRTNFETVDEALNGEGYEEVASPEEDVQLATMRGEVPEVVPVPQEGVDREEPDPSQYDNWDVYIHDLIEFEIGYQPDQAAMIDPKNPAENGTVLEGDLVDVTAGNHGVEVEYAISDKFLGDTDYPIESEEEMPDIWGTVESTTTIEYDADTFRELRNETIKAAKYLKQVDEALSHQPQP